MAPPYRIAILEDDADLRAYLEMIVDKAEDLELAFSAGTVGEAIRLTEKRSFDLALIDIKLPDGSGLDFLSHVRRSCDAKSLVLTVLGDRVSVTLALEAGADGYLLKDVSPAQLTRSIAQALAGETPLSPQAASYLLQMWKAAAPPPSSTADLLSEALTEREVEVLKLFSRGLSYREAAATLGISPHTVGDHVKAIYQKLSVHSRSEAVFEARQMGLISPRE